MTNYNGINIDYSRDANLSQFGLNLLKEKYLKDKETSPQEAFARAAVDYCAGDLSLAQRIYDYVSNQWVGLASPVLSNAVYPGQYRKGLPISCFAAGTPVITNTGATDIDKLKVGDLVLTHKNRFRKVLAFKESQSDDLYQLIVENNPTPLTVTGNHLIYTNLGWVRVDKLDALHHLVAITSNGNFKEVNHTIIFNNLVDNPKGQFVRHKLPEKVKVTEDLAWALGFWFAEGSTNNNGQVRVTNGAYEPCHKWAKIMGEHLGLPFVVNEGKAITKKGKPTHWFSGEVCSKTLQEWFDSSFGKGCKNKTLSEWVLNLPITHLESFWEGLYLGDGFKTSDTETVELSNPPLVAGLSLILSKLGKSHSLNLRKKIYTGYNGIVTIHKAKRDSRRFTSLQFKDGLYYNKIRSVAKLNITTKVYDIQVEEDASFCAARVVAHNCFLGFVDDSVKGLLDHTVEIANLTTLGGGTGGHWSSVRSASDKSPGSIPFIKSMDTIIETYQQGSQRRRGLCCV